MRKCWEEKFEKRPEFSYLVHTLGNMLTDSYKKVALFLTVPYHNISVRFWIYSATERFWKQTPAFFWLRNTARWTTASWRATTQLWPAPNPGSRDPCRSQMDRPWASGGKPRERRRWLPIMNTSSLFRTPNQRRATRRPSRSQKALPGMAENISDWNNDITLGPQGGAPPLLALIHDFSSRDHAFASRVKSWTLTEKIWSLLDLYLLY